MPTHSRINVKRVWIAAAVLAGFGVAFGTLMMFGWMIDETHFDRPDKGFDRLTAQLEETPGVNVDWGERWVEAPTFSDPYSWIHLTVDEAHLPGMLATACSHEYPDAVAWSIDVQTDAGDVVSLYTSAGTDGRSDDSRCPDFGFDAAGLVGAVTRADPGVDLQASIWDNGRFALVVLDEEPGQLSALLPLVDHSDELREAAGLDRSRAVEINSTVLSMIIPPDEDDLYLALLTDLAETHGVTSYSADGGGTPVDGVEKVQITAPDRERAEIEDAVRDSGLRIADYPVRFLPLAP